ncbi:hypothetical protein R3P38DRAFT_3569613 [Favolaschia claudopus]|uniref:Uncharacterized protein n=1 Tax=Favolaschia claudopus TaxID=2862362 RepID=A0AAW0AT51_9AGAR
MILARSGPLIRFFKESLTGDLSPSELGACNNIEPGTLLAVTPCIICGCRGAQHRERERPERKAAAQPPPPSSSSFPPSAASDTSPVPPVPPGSSFSTSFSMPSSTASTSTFPTSDFTFSATANPAQQPADSTSRTMFGSRPTEPAHAGPSNPRGRSSLPKSTAGPHSFRNVAYSREEITKAAMGMSSSGTASGSTTFLPALKAQMESDLNPLGTRPPKKRKKRDDRSPSRDRNVRPRTASSSTAAPKPPPAKLTKYCFLLMAATKDVNRGQCPLPAAHDLVHYEDAGYVKIIIISSDDSPHDIRTKRDKKGKLLPKAGISRVLRPLSRPLDFSAIEIHTRALVDSNIRNSGPRYRRIVFIALNPAGPNLPFHGVSYDSNDDLDHDLPSDYSDTSSDETDISMEEVQSEGEEETKMDIDGDKGKGKAQPDPDPSINSKAEKPPVDRKGKGKQKAEDSHFDAGLLDDDVAAGVEYDSDTGPTISAQETGPVVPQTHLTMVRLLHNMQQPDPKVTRPVNYWAEGSGSFGCFTAGNKAAELCARLLVQFIASPEASVLSAAQVLSFIESNVCQPFLMLTNLGKRLAGIVEVIGDDELEGEFDRSFCVGPGGLHGLAPHLLSAYMALPVALEAGASRSAYLAVRDNLSDLSLALLRCLQHLRMKHHRSEWDPRGGCRELAVILRTRDSSLPVGTEADFDGLNLRLLLSALEKDPPNVIEIHFLLMDALGDASNPREMTADRVLIGGEFGMGRFYELVVTRILDDLDTAHNASAAIARKIRNFIKSGGRRAAGPSSAPNTRSRASRSGRTTWKSDKEDDDMTNTDSLASGWEYDCSAASESDISIRRAQRHRKQHKPKQPKAPSPPIEISSDSESSSSSSSSSDEEWKRTYAQWKKARESRNAAAGSSTANAGPSANTNPAPSGSNSNATAGPSNSNIPTPLPQTRAQPAWIDPDALESDDVEDATTLLKRLATRYWQGLMREIVERFPHPDPSRRLTMDQLLAPGMTRIRQYHMLSLYVRVKACPHQHQRNIEESEHGRCHLVQAQTKQPSHTVFGRYLLSFIGFTIATSTMRDEAFHVFDILTILLGLLYMSIDVELKKKGLQTGINWYKVHESYLCYLLDGLRNRSKPVVALFRANETSLGGNDRGETDEGGLAAALNALREAGTPHAQGKSRWRTRLNPLSPVEGAQGEVIKNPFVEQSELPANLVSLWCRCEERTAADMGRFEGIGADTGVDHGVVAALLARGMAPLGTGARELRIQRVGVDGSGVDGCSGSKSETGVDPMYWSWWGFAIGRGRGCRARSGLIRTDQAASG